MRNYSKYLLSGGLEEKWGFFVTTVGYTKIDTNQEYPVNNQHPDTHKFDWNRGRVLDGYYLVFISGGEGVFESAKTEPANLKEGTCFLLFPGIWHRYKPLSQSGWEEYWVGFKGSYPEDLMENFDPENPFVQTGRSDTLLKLFHALIECVQQANPGYHQAITGIALQILAYVHAISKYHELNISNTAKLVEEAKFLLRESIGASSSVEHIWAKLPAGYSKLRKDFKTHTGLSPNQYQLNLRLEKAKELLLHTSLSVNEIAYQTGFESVFYMSRIFKKKIGMAPRSFRGHFSTKAEG